MKILITGSSGFIGFYLTKKLLDLGHEICGIDDHNDYYRKSLKEDRRKLLDSPKYTFFQQDINNISISENNFDLAINLAAQPGVRVKKSKQYLYEHTNIQGFKAFCNFCKRKNIAKIIYASSSAVYSGESKRKFSESITSLKPLSQYGRSKLMNEEYASYFAMKNNVHMVGLRFFSVYGPYGRPDMAYFSFTESLKRNETIKLNNKGEMFRDMTYIDDLIEGILGAINFISEQKEPSSNEIFNLGNERPIKTETLLRTLQKKLNKKSEIINIDTTDEAKNTYADITKAKNLLGYTPKVSFEEGINKFLKWHNGYENR